MNGLVNAKKWHSAKVRTLPSHCCGLSLIPTPGVTCGLSLLLVPLLVMWVFLPLQKPTSQLPICLGNSGQEEPPCGMQPA